MMSQESFVRYVNEFKRPDSRIFADAEKFRIGAMFVSPSADECRGDKDCDAEYSCAVSRKWQLWTRMDQAPMTPQEFAGFLLDNREDIVSPCGSLVCDIAKRLETRKGEDCFSVFRQEDGSFRLGYREGGMGWSAQDVPEGLVLRIAPFADGASLDVPAWMRCCLGQDGLGLDYKLDRPLEKIDRAFRNVLETVEKETSLKVVWISGKTSAKCP